MTHTYEQWLEFCDYIIACNGHINSSECKRLKFEALFCELCTINTDSNKLVNNAKIIRQQIIKAQNGVYNGIHKF